MTTPATIAEVESLKEHRHSLVELLRDGVNGGASIGFIAPLCEQEAGDYWASVNHEISRGTKIVFIAHSHHQIVGAVQLSLCLKKNGVHRGEVEKLMVHSQWRGQGVGKQLMKQLEKKALDLNLTLLLLDTRTGDVASQLYESIGYTLVGDIPDFSLNSEGHYEATRYYYKAISLSI